MNTDYNSNLTISSYEWYVFYLSIYTCNNRQTVIFLQNLAFEKSMSLKDEEGN